MKVNSVIKNGSLYMFGNLFNKAIAFITVPIFTRMLTTEEYGIVNTYSSWVSMLAVVVGLSLGSSIKNALVDYPDQIGEYISSIFTLAIVNFGVAVVLFQAIASKLPLSRTMLMLCLIESFGNFAVNAVISLYIMQEKAVKRTSLMVMPNLTGAIISIVLVSMLNSEKYYGRIWATCLSTTVFGLSLMLFYLCRYKCFVNLRYWKYALVISLPLILHGLSCNILGTSDRTIITMYRGAAETGLYSLIYNLSMVAGVVTSSAESVWIPKLYSSLVAEDNKRVNQQIEIYLYSVLFAFCGLQTIAPELVLVLGGREYLSGLNMITPIVGASFIMFLYGIYVNIECYYKCSTTIAMSTIAAALLNLVLNFIFIPSYGAFAASITTMFSYVVSLLLHMRKARRLNKKIASPKLLITPILIFVVSSAFTVIFVNNMPIRWGTMILAGAIYIVFYGRKFRNIAEGKS